MDIATEALIDSFTELLKEALIDSFRNHVGWYIVPNAIKPKEIILCYYKQLYFKIKVDYRIGIVSHHYLSDYSFLKQYIDEPHFVCDMARYNNLHRILHPRIEVVGNAAKEMVDFYVVCPAIYCLFNQHDCHVEMARKIYRAIGMYMTTKQQLPVH